MHIVHTTPAKGFVQVLCTQQDTHELCVSKSCFGSTLSQVIPCCPTLPYGLTRPMQSISSHAVQRVKPACLSYNCAPLPVCIWVQSQHAYPTTCHTFEQSILSTARIVSTPCVQLFDVQTACRKTNLLLLALALHRNVSSKIG